MAVARLLEDFGSIVANDPAASGPLTEEVFETRRLEAFEQGYTAGWDDATAAQNDERTRISSDLAQNLADLSFTYHEAYAAVTEAMTPLLTKMVESLLPELGREALAAQILGQLQKIARDVGARRVELVVAPANRDLVAKLLEDRTDLDVAIVEDRTLGAGQAYLRFNDTEVQVDLDEVLDGITAALAGFVHENRQEIRHG